jgi:UDP-N-acetylmuramoyl-L-alanyl-D-glutamate--2,6-diaminopimelate ligase
MMAAEQQVPGMGLAALLDGAVAVPGSLDVTVTGLSADTRTLEPGQVFFARRGVQVDGERFLDDAARAGAAAVIAHGAPGARGRADGVTEVRVADVAATMGMAADRYFGHPSRHLELVGVTGTNGKSSVSLFIAHAISARERRAARTPCGVLGTLGYGLHGTLAPSLLTTPDSIAVHRHLAELRAAGARYGTMEVSSHALDQGRVEGVRFAGAVFTNLSRDHLDYHDGMDAYADAKRKLFQQPGIRFAVLNEDDELGARLRQELAGRLRTIAFGVDSTLAECGAEHWVRGHVRTLTAAGIELHLTSSQGEAELSTSLLGRFNADNLLAALATLLAMGWTLEDAVTELAHVEAPAGRMQRFGGDGAPLVVVDYSHTPDALGRALESLREQCPGRLWCVFGAGGDRDRGKRAHMGAAAARFADHIVLTDDNPRSEDGDGIIADIREGIPADRAVLAERDRAVAIRVAVTGARSDDMVLVAGKGHEAYQESGGKRRPFSDGAAVRSALEARQG